MTEEKQERRGALVEIEFSLDARVAVLAFMLILVGMIVLNNPYNFVNAAVQTLIVLGAGTIILIVYEEAHGRKMDTHIDWKDILKMILGIVGGLMAILAGGLLAMMSIYDVYFLLGSRYGVFGFASMMAVGAITIAIGAVIIARLFD